MRPTYFELLQLNPLLKKRSPEEVEVLINAIEECGYMWDPSKKMFWNTELSHGVRTQGLDMFTPERFRNAYLEVKQRVAEHPEADALYRWYRNLFGWIPKFIVVIFLWGILGWIFTEWLTWLLILLGMIIAFVCFFVFIGKGMEKAGKIERGEK